MNWRMFLIAPPIVFGVLMFMWMTADTGTATEGETPEAALAVRVQEIATETLVAQASGFGRVEAIQTWHAIPEVAGRAVELGPDVAVGEVVKEGALLLRIDPRDYEIGLTKAKTAVASARAGLKELSASAANTRATLALEEEIEAFFKTELTRQEELAQRGTAPQSVLDTARRTLLSQQKVVLGLRNSLSLVPVQKQTLEATLAARLADQEDAERALANVEIRAPFEGRLVAVDVAEQEYVRAGNAVLELDNSQASEVTAEFQPAVLSALIRGAAMERMAGNADDLDLFTVSRILGQLGLEAEVRVKLGASEHVWPAGIVRVNGETDAETATIGIVVRVENPGLPDPSKARPPLNNGTFAEVRLKAPERAGAILVDRDVVRRDEGGQPFVYLADSDNRLARATVTLGPSIGGRIVVMDGLEAGALLVVSDPQPAIRGMLLTPVADTRGEP